MLDDAERITFYMDARDHTAPRSCVCFTGPLS